MLRTRARDNEAYFIFTHPAQTLVISPEGKIIVNKEDDQGAGIVYSEIGLNFKPVSKLVKRRSEAFIDRLSKPMDGTSPRLSRPGELKVAAVQMHSSHNLHENIERICTHLAQCARQGVRVAVFPECATTGYFKEDIPGYSEQDFIEAEKRIAETCKRFQIYAVIGSPYFENGKVYNMGLIIDPSGNTVYRQPKIHQVGGDKPWSVSGNRLGVFTIDGETCSLIICHDSRYPELVRLPVIKGSRLLFYLSCESDVTAEQKIEPYRAQVVARAVENQIFVVQSNTPQNTQPREGSHGQSRIVDPKGIILKEASIFNEEIVSCTINLKEATGSTAFRSMEAPFLQEWWQNGLKQVGVHE
jgi:predicted amidohydrolase